MSGKTVGGVFTPGVVLGPVAGNSPSTTCGRAAGCASAERPAVPREQRVKILCLDQRRSAGQQRVRLRVGSATDQRRAMVTAAGEGDRLR